METAAPERKPLLELQTLAPERPIATIDDVAHEFRLLHEFGAIEHQEFDRDSQRFNKLWGAEKSLTKAEGREIETLLDRLFAKALVDPTALRDQLGDRLTGAIKREIVLTFTNAPLLMRLMAQETETEKAGDQSSTTAS